MHRTLVILLSTLALLALATACDDDSSNNANNANNANNVNNVNNTIVPECEPGETRDGTTVCGANDEGVYVEECDAVGLWQATSECTGTDICENGTTREGTTPCHEQGVFIDECINGAWVVTDQCTYSG